VWYNDSTREAGYLLYSRSYSTPFFFPSAPAPPVSPLARVSCRVSADRCQAPRTKGSHTKHTPSTGITPTPQRLLIASRRSKDEAGKGQRI
jgi:hypothetical protein